MDVKRPTQVKRTHQRSFVCESVGWVGHQTDQAECALGFGLGRFVYVPLFIIINS